MSGNGPWYWAESNKLGGGRFSDLWGEAIIGYDHSCLVGYAPFDKAKDYILHLEDKVLPEL